MGQADAADTIQPLLDAIRQAGDSGAIEAQAELYLLFYDQILRSSRMPDFLEGYSREDLVEEAFFQSIAAVQSGNLTDGKAFSGYWYKTVQHRIFNLRRDAQKRRTVREKLSRMLYGKTAPDGERQMIDKELIDRVRQLMDNLSEQCREILRLDALDYSAAQIVLKTGYGSTGTIYVTKSRCLNKLRKIVAAQNLKDPRYE